MTDLLFPSTLRLQTLRRRGSSRAAIAGVPLTLDAAGDADVVDDEADEDDGAHGQAQQRVRRPPTHPEAWAAFQHETFFGSKFWLGNLALYVYSIP